jgi:hypothetical protein
MVDDNKRRVDKFVWQPGDVEITPAPEAPPSPRAKRFVVDAEVARGQRVVRQPEKDPKT